MIRRPPRSTRKESSAASDVYKRQVHGAWSPMFDLINIFESFLPQLLIYPNSEDPLNPEAATLQMKFPDTYKKKVKIGVRSRCRNTWRSTRRRVSRSTTMCRRILRTRKRKKKRMTSVCLPN
eukprot:TRINITY_DN2933_c0_g4_i4.p2 TRINITY_DN2933_c0_g4~~TRINITY_DN2933_c0_g4_i4.p2  ORF type:complete len:129 (-),score=25.75 TRINITY_DN2933_c0_g4_i4:94-459(-)